MYFPYYAVSELFRCLYALDIAAVASCDCPSNNICSYDVTTITGFLRQTCLCVPRIDDKVGLQRHTLKSDIEFSIEPHYNITHLRFSNSDYHPRWRYQSDTVFLPYYCYVLSVFGESLSIGITTPDIDIFTSRTIHSGMEYWHQCNTPKIASAKSLNGDISIYELPYEEGQGDFVYLHDCNNNHHVCGHYYHDGDVTLFRCHLKCTPSPLKTKKLSYFDSLLHPFFNLFTGLETLAEQIATFVATVVLTIAKILLRQLWIITSIVVEPLLDSFVSYRGIECTVVTLATYVVSERLLPSLLVGCFTAGLGYYVNVHVAGSNYDSLLFSTKCLSQYPSKSRL